MVSHLSLSFWPLVPLSASHNSSSLFTPSLTSLSFKACTDAGFWILEVGSAWIDELGLDQWARIGWWWVWIGWSVGLNRWICWSMGGSVGLIVDSSYGDFFFEWVCFWFWFWFDRLVLVWWWWHCFRVVAPMVIFVEWVWSFGFGFGLIICFWFGFDRLVLVWWWWRCFRVVDFDFG